VVLRRQGHSLAEIAGQTGLHPDSVRRVLRTLARQLAFKGQESEVRGRKSEVRGQRSEVESQTSEAGSQEDEPPTLALDL
jgi:hypothetical protein